MRPLLVLGIMSGTSMDSVDYALCHVNRAGIRLRQFWQVAYPAALQRRLHRAASNRLSSHELAQLHHDLGRFLARGARRHGAKPDLAGVHGQTIFHNPSRVAPATFQLGEPAYLVESLRAPVINNFRAADVAAGGQGAPLATLFHQLVFGRPGQHVCVNNLGGISNVTSMDWSRGSPRRIVAFDTGPANVLLDLAMRHFTRNRLAMDRHGAWARRGRPAETLVNKWLRHPFFRKSPPKSTGRELFGEPFFERVRPGFRQARLSKFDVVATLTAFVARSLALSYRLHLARPPRRVILSGGGAANRALVAAIRVELGTLKPSPEILTSNDLGWPLQSVEPAAFALLAWRRWQGLPGNLAETTGARRPVLAGQLSEP